ncbi:MAG: cytochrome C [Deltaproteobacteria bacterium]|nr:cytochrome C [Deltaproteobacteria bacterium]
MTSLRSISAVGLTFLICLVAALIPASFAQDIPVYNPYPAGLLPSNLDPELMRVAREVDHIENEAISQWQALPLRPDTRLRQIQILGKLELFDRSLSVFGNVACTSCHMPYTGFTSPISSINQSIVANPGSVRYRMAQRKPMSYVYAPFSPVEHLNKTQNEFFGGNFWDMHSTGAILQNPSPEQAQDPPTDPLEMGMPDSACVIYRLSQAPYRPLFEHIWGSTSFDINWPANTNEICTTPAGSAEFGNNPQPLPLNQKDRDQSNTNYNNFAMAITAEEYGPDTSPFTSKFDAFLAGKATLSSDEQAGYELWNGKAKCNSCHLDNNDAINNDGKDNLQPMFTDWSAHNLGLPKNPAIPYLYENVPDPFGFTPNPQGKHYIDRGFGDFLRGKAGPFTLPPPDEEWFAYAEKSDGKFQTATARDADMRPCPGFVKSYFHNGVIKSLKELVHFYNTRDVLPRCAPDSSGEGITCWPPPEVPENVDQTIGNLGLTDKEENQIIAFLGTLTDGYTVPYPDFNTYTGACK